ncbi:hypothetical protein N7481_000024 [Penicillium waksmanii]|uniref:uncharacterized protein n=1 Tax=Penicillium waksmanii TaxID=69791 RepID=UPI002546F998|nr:uncharacterized protein N7481_000024 [Penicillium waksmanii]KAJ5999615.1 hypothetical protein N7481_000024 [Penicillium waksmanii]
MSKPLVIRVGGTSGDHVFFNRNQDNGTYSKSGPESKKNSKDTFYIGPSYFDTFKRFQKASMSIKAPMGAEVDMENTVAYIQQAWKALGKSRLAAIALGNEPNSYRKSEETLTLYVIDALDVESQIIKNLSLIGDDSHIFQVGEIASRSVLSDKFNL